VVIRLHNLQNVDAQDIWFLLLISGIVARLRFVDGICSYENTVALNLK
jgi:hypothetical protein